MAQRSGTNGARARTESTAGERLQSAGRKAADAYQRVRRHAERVTEEMDEVTSPHGIPTANLDKEDSLVTTIAETIASTTRVVGSK